jgi:hypothetical protein
VTGDGGKEGGIGESGSSDSVSDPESSIVIVFVFPQFVSLWLDSSFWAAWLYPRWLEVALDKVVLARKFTKQRAYKIAVFSVRLFTCGVRTRRGAV